MNADKALSNDTARDLKTILQLENAPLKFVLRSDASGEITVKATGVVWRQWPVAIQEDGDFDQHLGWVAHHRPSFTLYPGRFSLRREGDDIHVEMTGSPLNRRCGSFVCRYRLDGPWLELSITRIDAELPSLVFPPPLESDALLVPSSGSDAVVRDPDAQNSYPRASRWDWKFSPRPAMRWFGGLRGPEERHGWIAIFSGGYEDAGVLSSGVAASPVWMRSLDTWNTRRVLRYGFTDAGFVGLAKLFRKWAKDDGLWGVPLTEKLAAKPHLSCMVGGRHIGFMLAHRHEPRRYEDIWQKVPCGLPPEGELVVNMDFLEARRLADAIKAAGMKKGVFKYDGWGKGGYDERHPETWPPETALGTMGDFEALCRETPPYLTCLHDSYSAVYEQSPGFPKAVCLDRQGQPMRVGFWSGGQSYASSTRDIYPWAAANAKRIRAAGCLSHYYDAFGFLTQSFEPGNTLTRAEDREWHERTFAASRELGMIVGSEHGLDFFVAHTDWSPKGAHTLMNNRLPLWSMVFNDAHLGMRAVAGSSRGQDPATLARSTRRRVLENMLFGFGTTFRFNNFDDWRAQQVNFANAWFADQWHESVALEEMIDHQVLSEDGMLRRSVFASGKAVTANLADTPSEGKGITLNGLEYRTE